MKIGAVLACVVGLIAFSSLRGSEKEADREQEEALAEIKKMRGIVFLDPKTGKPDGVVLTANKDVNNDTLKAVSKLATLRILTITGPTAVTDDGLKHLKKMKSLKMLSLVTLKVGDDGVSNLNDLQTLTELNLAATQITDAGLQHLFALTKLKKLDVTDTKVTTEGMKSLKDKLPDIKIKK